MEEETGACLLVDYFERLLGNFGKLDGTSYLGKDFVAIFWIFACEHLKYFNDN